MRIFLKTLQVPAGTGDGTYVSVKDYREKTVQIFGTFVATLQIEVSLNGADFVPVQTGITTKGIYTVPHTCAAIRVSVTAFTSGTPQAMFGGFDARSV